ncbi:MAG: hypothetical protein M3R08_04750 [Bacteroidota bacterium]|nr:hypothetical protein [Bacteroidota bacterium]
MLQEPTFLRILNDHPGEPVLVDVGASGGAPKEWLPLASRSWYIAFDPDQREMTEVTTDGTFKRKTVVNEAITHDPSNREVRFNLTRSPFCSSILTPDHELVANFFGGEKFDVLDETVVKASTLNEVMQRIGCTKIDWLKLDTQGTDRRIYDSLSETLRHGLLAVDLEPGLRGAYLEEDLFGDVHKSMLRDGFWLSKMETKGFVRMRQTTLDHLSKNEPDLDQKYVEKAVRRTPGWTELRYLRSIGSLKASGASKRDIVLLWAIATMDEQYGFGLDLASHWEASYGLDATCKSMRQGSLEQIKAQHARMNADAQRSRLKGRIKNVMRRFIP